MSKAILIIDIPDVDYANRFLWKPKIEYKIFNQVLINNKPLYTPMGIHGYEELKPMPKKLLILGRYQDNELLNSEEVAYAKGRNDCLDEILELEEKEE